MRKLLAESVLSLAEIGTRTGFKHVEYLSTTFKQKVGLPPAGIANKTRIETRRNASVPGLKENDLLAMPVVNTCCEICRDDLLFEIELDAITAGC